MDQRKLFIEEWLQGTSSFSELCRLFGVSRSNGYKWVGRFKAEGLSGLQERSRAPHRHPNAAAEDVVELVVAARRQFPRWGARKLVAWLAGKYPRRDWPAPSTVGEILRRRGLTTQRRRRSRPGNYASCLTGYYGPNAVWQTDFKGYLRTQDRLRCDPFTLSDGFSRYLLRCDAMRTTRFEAVQPIFDAAFCEFGLPDVIRSDNGAPFSSCSGLSPLSIWWIKLEIRPERIAPGKPTQNGIHERIHRTMVDEGATRAAANIIAQQQRFDSFRQTYNEQRPHEGLSNKTPASVYVPSSRHYPTKLREPEYSEVFEVVRVGKDAKFTWKGQRYTITRRLENQPIGIRELANGFTEIRYGPLVIAHLTPRRRFKRGRPPGPDPAQRSRRSSVIEAFSAD